MKRRFAWIAFAALAGCARRYHVQGLVLQSDPEKRTILVSHRTIDGYMPAMTMSFRVAPREDLSKAIPGARVDFDLHVSKRESIARNLHVRETKIEDVNVAPPANKLAIGAAVPDFSLVDQAGRRVRLSDFRGRVVALDFIYTRCPLPDVCPRLSAGFAYVAKKLPDVQLLSITIDPQFDTPAVLADYGRRYGANGETWRFLTGPMDRIREVAGLFGLIYWAEEGAITHSVATAVIGRDAHLAALIQGSSYRPEQLKDLISEVASEAHKSN